MFDLIDLFQIPFVRMDGGLKVVATVMLSVFGNIEGQEIICQR